MKCGQVGCSEEALSAYSWPGTEEPIAACLGHYEKAVAIAIALGFRLQGGPGLLAILEKEAAERVLRVVMECDSQQFVTWRCVYGTNGCSKHEPSDQDAVALTTRPEVCTHGYVERGVCQYCGDRRPATHR